MNTDYVIANPDNVDNIKWTINPSSITKNGNTIKFTRIRSSIAGPSGDGQVLMVTGRLFSYGVAEKPKQEGPGFDYSVALVMYDSAGPTPDQLKLVNALDKVSENARKFLLANQKAIGKDWIESDLRKMNILWRGKEGKSQVPTLYAKLPVERGRVTCTFKQPYRKGDEVLYRKVDPMTLKDQRCTVKAAIHIDNVYIGANVPSFQVKIYELIIYPTAERESVLDIDDADIDDLPEEEELKEVETETKESESNALRALDSGIMAPVQAEVAPVVVAPIASYADPVPRRGRGAPK